MINIKGAILGKFIWVKLPKADHPERKGFEKQAKSVVKKIEKGGLDSLNRTERWMVEILAREGLEAILKQPALRSLGEVGSGKKGKK